MEKLVIVPTYNERENVGPLLDKVLGLPWGLDILIVDDNSPDGTAAVVQERMKSEPRIHLLQRPGKMGLGSAYRDGFRYALERGAEYIFEMDAAFSHDPQAIGQFLAAIHDADIVLVLGPMACALVRWCAVRSRLARWSSAASRSNSLWLRISRQGWCRSRPFESERMLLSVSWSGVPEAFPPRP